MSKIREGLEGVVTAYDEAGQSVVLVAGDDVPKGVEVGEHVLAESAAPAKKSAARKSASADDDD